MKTIRRFSYEGILFYVRIWCKRSRQNYLQKYGNIGTGVFVFRDNRFPGTGAVLVEELLNRCLNLHNCNNVFFDR